MQATSLHFAAVARSLGQTARARSLTSPAFRSPPRLAEVDRTLKWSANGVPTVAVRLGDRPFGAVVADMVEGVVVANRLAGGEATRVRTALWEAVSIELELGARAA